ncbi:MAG: outer membrane protein transport protein [Pirellulales bacterium]|nr:outer membrane protein transport protein [Pirellulales bacterium]
MVRWVLVAAGAWLAVSALAPRQTQAQGIFLTGTGPINQAMGGAAVAAPIDSAGALNWNSASISGLRRSEMQIALGAILPTMSLDSQAFGLSGSTPGESGVTPVPTMSWVGRNPNSPWTFGIGVYGVGGFSSNYPASSLANPLTANPILTPQPPFGIGVGRVYAKAEIYQVALTVAYALTDRLSIGLAPNIDLANVQADPLFLAPPNFVGGVPNYGPGTGSRYTWGGGFQCGLFYVTDLGWQFGASYKSKQWFEPLHYNSNDVLGNPVFNRLQFDLPSIISIGAAYTGFERLVYAIDVRYFDYAGADGFSAAGFLPTGAVAGLGWKSVFGVANGLRYQLTDRLALLGGYTYIENPIPSSQEFFNIGTPLIMQHFLSLGASIRFGRRTYGNVAWTHGFEGQLTGPYQTPFGSIPGTSVTSKTTVDQITVGVQVLY